MVQSPGSPGHPGHHHHGTGGEEIDGTNQIYSLAPCHGTRHGGRIVDTGGIQLWDIVDVTNMHIYIYMVGGWDLPLWKMMENRLGCWDHEIPNWMEKNQTCSKPPTRKFVFAPLESDNKIEIGRSYWKSSIEIRDLWMFIWPEKPSEKPAKSRTLCHLHIFHLEVPSKPSETCHKPWMNHGPIWNSASQ